MEATLAEPSSDILYPLFLMLTSCCEEGLDIGSIGVAAAKANDAEVAGLALGLNDEEGFAEKRRI